MEGRSLSARLTTIARKEVDMGPDKDSPQEERDLWSDVNNPNNDKDLDDWADGHNPNNDDCLESSK